MTALDPRLHAYRPDLADARLRGRVEAARFVAGTPRQVVASHAPLKRVPASDAALDSEVLRGETFTVFDDTPEGWSWGQLVTDGYVGYVPTDALRAGAAPLSHRVAQLRAFVFPGPDMKLPAIAALPFGAGVSLDRESTTRGTRYLALAGGEGWVAAVTVAPANAPPAPDFVSVAERFLGVAYLWGGRTSGGLDCSALVQLSLMAGGVPAPRDTDMQEAALGEAVASGSGGDLRRGDLVFWKGHVAILIDANTLVHASGHHMAVVREPLREAVARIAATGGERTSVRRLTR